MSDQLVRAQLRKCSYKDGRISVPVDALAVLCMQCEATYTKAEVLELVCQSCYNAHRACGKGCAYIDFEGKTDGQAMCPYLEPYREAADA